MTLTDCFRILDLPRNAGLSDLKLAYRSKAKKYHPDRKGGNSRQFNLLHEAYTFLLDHSLFDSGQVDYGINEKNRRENEERAGRAKSKMAAEERIKKEASKRAAAEKLRRETEEKAASEQKIREMEKRAGEKRAAYEKAHRISELKKARERARSLSEKKVSEEQRRASGSHKIFALGEILNKSGSDREKISAIKSLAALKRKSAYPFLKEALYDSSEAVVIASINAIGQLKIHQAGSELTSLISSGSINVKTAILDIVILMGKEKQYLNIIHLAIRDSHLPIRQKAEVINKSLYG